jgi:hypothetical protein
MNDELERILKEEVMAEFKTVSRHLPGRTAEDHKTSFRTASLRGPTKYE